MEDIVNSISKAQKIVQEFNDDSITIDVLAFCLKQLGRIGPILVSVSDAFVDREEEIEPLHIGVADVEITMADIIRFLAELVEVIADADRDNFTGIHKRDDKFYVFDLD